MKTLHILYLLIISINISGQEVITGIATKVYDGDTFTLVTEENASIKIRVVGIDAPEKDQKHGVVARDFARNLIDNKKVTVYLEPGQTYGRRLGVVITSNGKHFNYEMVKRGHAWHYKHYNSDKFLSAAENEAKESKVGLWADNNPEAPWEYRRRNN
jgi:endonuclease YncB( thermonuclease family)